ncbi:TerB family tellurite resistance protein [Oceanicella actignis]|uniref:Uncharacterized conserved protein, tellurite resistance protein B (TerB) family n=1 Tax=Oceanicella actignis TaxID=1189325 RepID=A0A1M7S0D4_9RHOB|nr:TerB family tellurite resistance protein [Oceanicella actignis]SES93773.1 Uncharacterized conserved protein, tellurite resistance protein B (TerB) family [Oceanicella actignis]SHN51941.1 Uncharacterized conserved protein, tellurite resistance protein B (TerB) family [Oceanicella actignis]
MFKSILDLLSGRAAQPLPPEDGRVALAALLVRAARADGMFDEDERRAVAAALAARHGLDQAAARALTRQAEEIEREAPDTVRFTRALKNATPYEERAALVEALWRVILADGRRAPEEDALARQVCALLGVSDQDGALARRRAEAAGGPDARGPGPGS